MENPRPEKVAVVTEVRERLESSSAVLLTEYRGLKVSEIATLRRSLKAAGGDYKVYKNTLVRFAVRDLGIEGVEDLLVGPTAVAFVDGNGDAAAVAKALRDYGRTNPNLVLKGGVLGDKALSADEARALAELPSREVLLARIAGGLAAPMVQFAGLLQALPRNMAYGLKALIDQKVAGGEAPAAAAEAPTEDAPGTDAPAPDSDVTDAPAAEATETDAAPAADETPAEAPAAAEAPAEDAPAAEAEAIPETEAEAPAAEAETAEEA